MDSAESLSHSKWECKYHVIFIPKGGCPSECGNPYRLCFLQGWRASGVIARDAGPTR
jgi:hypothetical protein